MKKLFLALTAAAVLGACVPGTGGDWQVIAEVETEGVSTTAAAVILESGNFVTGADVSVNGEALAYFFVAYVSFGLTTISADNPATHHL